MCVCQVASLAGFAGGYTYPISSNINLNSESIQDQFQHSGDINSGGASCE